MSSAPSFKELTRAISAFIPSPSLPLPDDLVEIIEGYLRKHEKFDESVSDKLNEELQSIYQKEVVGFPTRYGAFLNILRRLRPLTGQPARIFQWWDLLLPIFNILKQEKDIAKEAQALVLDILTADGGNESDKLIAGVAVPLAEKILTRWLEDFHVSGREDDALANLTEKQLRETLIIYGKKRPKDFMTVLDRFIVKKAWRARCLYLTADFIKSQPPHLHQVLNTPLFDTLINCLQLDTSTTIISLALTVLTMVLPHLPSSLVPHLPRLFNIYARLLFWERELSATEPGVGNTDEHRLSPTTGTWEKSAYTPDFDDTAIPHLLDYFTILYGLYPINFMDYIRKPQRYLRHAEDPNADDIEIQPTEIRHASEHFRQCHLLHENFYTLTIDSEKTDFGRWIKSDPAEVVADCMALRQIVEAGASHVSPHFDNEAAPVLSVKDDSDKDGHESALLSGMASFSGVQGESWRNSQVIGIESPPSSRVQSAILRHSSQSSRQSHRDSSSTRPSRNGGESPALGAQLHTSGSQTHLQDMINSNKVIKSGLHQSLANDSVPSLALSHHESIPERSMSHVQLNIQSSNTPTSAADNNDARIRSLYRQILLLHNDLTFERYIKQQHLTHMGELRRRLVREAASEAETQNLIMTNRHLKQRLEESKMTELQVKKDSERSRSLSKKWEADLSTKLRALREEQKTLTAERDGLKRELEVAKGESEQLRTLVCEAEVREMGWKQSMQSVEIESSELQRLRKEVERLTIAERDFQANEAERQSAMTQAAEAESRAEMLRMKLSGRDTEFRQTNELYQSQIVVLNAKLQDALKNGTERSADGIKMQFENALVASRTQQVELKNRIADLARKNTALNAKLLEMQSMMPSESRPDGHRPVSPDIDESVASTDSGSPLSFRNRRSRGISDPESFEAMSYNPTPPLEPYNTAGSQPSSTPPGTEAPSSSRGSPVERYYGRGGVQNAIRKDKRDKKEDKDKDKKKSGGIRGIRGLYNVS